MQSPKIFGPHQRRLYVTLLALRLAFALQPSYLHPDEHYQSLAPFAARFFPNWNSAGQVTWEWDARKPIRSVVVLWPLLGGLMRGVGLAGRGPEVLFYATRVAWFVLSIVVGACSVFPGTVRLLTPAGGCRPHHRPRVSQPRARASAVRIVIHNARVPDAHVYKRP